MTTVAANNTGRLAELSAVLSSAADDLARFPALKEHAGQFREAAHDLLLPPLVVVMGGFNAGKSTLLNAMLGQDFLKMNVLPATATVTMLCRGKSGLVYGHSTGLPVRIWPLSELWSVTAEGFPDC